MRTAADTVREWKRRLQEREFEHMADVVDLDDYTEICLGLTGWTTGYEVAFENYVRNMVEPWSDQKVTEIEDVAGEDTVVTRSHIDATHTGQFLGVAATGRKVEWDVISIVKVRDGRIFWQWIQPDLWGIYQQLTRP
jgi:predicted ester cyclase